MVKTERIHIIKEGKIIPGEVVYWMSRDQRADDNWALIYAREMAERLNKGLSVIFCLSPDFLGATLRQYGFMLRSLIEVKSRLENIGIKFNLLIGNPKDEIPDFLNENRASILIADFDPLRIKREWKEGVSSKITIPMHEVDTHNIVPCFHVSSKIEFGAYTIRPKITRLLPFFMDEFPEIKPFEPSVKNAKIPDIEKLLIEVGTDRSISEVSHLIPGEKAALKMLHDFIENKLENYLTEKNDPNKDACSGLSAYLHFGQISAQRVALEIIKNVPKSASVDSFLEELIVRRELSDNYCYYNPLYDSFEGFPEWAKRSLDSQRNEKREFIYTREAFEEAYTHDPLWNAAQNEMKQSGRMHGYMRMYWAKKILEWTRSPEEALKIALYLNDKYQLDGRDPNGYVGCAWSIGGVHDRAWANRPVFGKIRYMNFNGAKRKFNVEEYIAKWTLK